MYQGGLSEEDMRDVAEGANGRDCSSFFGSMMCSITQQYTGNQLREQALRQDLAKTREKYLVVDSEGFVLGKTKKWFGTATDKEGTQVCAQEGGMSWEKCQADIINKGACKKEDTKCLSEAKNKFMSKAKIGDLDQYNSGIIDDYLTNFKNSGYDLDDNDKTKIMENCKDGATQTCSDAVTKSSVCNNRNSEECQRLIKDMNIATGLTTVEKDLRYSIATAILNPDQDGLKAAKYFGYEADYSNLPDWLKQDMETSVCSSKIDGYLDKTVENDGGTTSYGACTDNDLDADPSALCLDVIADIRAQRSAITPDNNTLVTFSYYLRGHPNDPLVYIVGLSYVSDGVRYKDVLVNTTTLAAGTNAKDFKTHEILVKGGQNVDPGSFRIAIAAFGASVSVETGDITGVSKSALGVYTSIGAPVVLATPEAYTIDGNRDISNSIAANQEEEGESLTANDLLDMMDLG